MVRSPRALTKIAEIAEATPSTRTQPLASTPSGASPARMRSLIGSCPAGPPSGPAKLACPPSRAIAIAALAAQPPPTATNSLACALPSAGGNSSTRKISSSTAIPVQRMRGAAPGPAALVEGNDVAFDPGADDVMRDRDRRRRAKPVGMLAHQHQRDLVAVEPARALELGRIDLDVVIECLGVAADHQRHGERPGLRREVGDAPARDPGLFVHLAAHRLLDVLAGLHEPGEARPHRRRKARRSAEQALLAAHRQHDDDRIGAREMLGPAGRADALPA